MSLLDDRKFVCQDFELKPKDIEEIRLDWLPSVPLSRKDRTPCVPGIAVIYSEKDSIVYSVFESDNINESSSTHAGCLRYKLNSTTRIAWVEVQRGTHRTSLITLIKAAYLG